MERATSPLPAAKKQDKKTMDFIEAVRQISKGRKVTRLEWEDKEVYGVSRDGYLVIHRDGRDHQWVVSDGDLYAEDWVVI